MNPNLAEGCTHTVSVSVSRELTVPGLPGEFPGFADMPEVFATGMMVAFAECAAMGALAAYLEEDEGSVGIDVSFDHTAPTPVGCTVTATATVTAVTPRVVSFSIELADDAGPIAHGTHRRAIIRRSRFETTIAQKRSDFAAEAVK